MSYFLTDDLAPVFPTTIWNTNFPFSHHQWNWRVQHQHTLQQDNRQYQANSLSKLIQEFNPFRRYYTWLHQSHQMQFDSDEQLNSPMEKSGEKSSSTLKPAISNGNVSSVINEWERKILTSPSNIIHNIRISYPRWKPEHRWKIEFTIIISHTTTVDSFHPNNNQIFQMITDTRTSTTTTHRPTH